MESSTGSLIYKGSISEAINEAQKQKKLFLVYISGEDENSANLVNSTWADERVSESVSGYCIFLHLIEGHVEASQFSAIYPQKSVPSISAVGYNGVMLWQHEGYINVESFVENIAKAWATMHFQDTAAAFLTAAIATKKPEPSSSVSTDVAPIEQGESPSCLHDPLPLADNHAQNLEAGPSNDRESLVEQQVEDINNEDKHLQLHSAIAVKTHQEGIEIKERGTVENLSSVTQIIPNSAAATLVNASQENHSKFSPEPAGEIILRSPQSSQIHASDVHEGKVTVNNEVINKKNATKSTDIHLSIRMPSGASLQAKFIVSDRLRSVKSYVDDNNGSMIGSYDLAIPYPRKVFVEEDMNKSLAELGFTGRQAVIAIPKSEGPPGFRRGLLSNDIRTSTNETNSSDSALEYFVYVKRILSYINPFSYLSGNRSESSTSEQTPNDGLWQYRPNPGLQNSLSGRETAHNPYPSIPQNSATDGDANILGRNSRPFGSNIHTLRQDEDDFRSDDRNMFWNGNSTQFGGDDK